MRIQHNIMAMSAYRNYTNNVSAMKKNLEKLSSGYKINRAGDDAAGLAISEKMRAQITGLETAQKNAKDGISLIQTAEGALTEVHDMLNRMVELASMSANGTYDDTTDRNQLQKELDQLRSEIDRIADSSNFNGIKLLDGSMDRGGTKQDVTITLPPDAADQYGEIGDKTIYKGTGAAAKETKFGVQFDNLAIDAKAGDTLEVDVGGTKITLTLEEKKYTAEELATALKAEFDKDPTAAKFGANGGQEFTAAIGADKTSVIFTQAAKPTGPNDTVEATMDVKMTYTPTGGTAMPLIDDGIQTFESNGSSAISGTASSNIKIDGSDAVAAVYEATVAVGTLAAGDKITIGTKTFTVIASGTATVSQVLLGDVNTAEKMAQYIAGAASDANYTISADGAKLVFTAKNPGLVGGTKGGPASAAKKPTFSVATSGSTTKATFAVGSVASKTAGADAVAGTKTANASGLNKDAIKAAADAVASIADGDVTIELNSTSGKLELKIGSKVIGVASQAVATTAAASVTYNFATASGTALGSVKLSGSVGKADITKALNTGLTYTVSGDGDKTGTVASSKLPDGGIDFSAAGSTAVAASKVTALQAAIDALGAGSKAGTVLLNNEVEVNLKNALDGLKKDGTDTVQDVANALLKAAQEGAKAWNTANASASYTYENVRISKTAAGTGANDIIAQAAGDGYYILMDKTPKGGGSGAGVSGSYNAATVAIDQGNAVQADQRASTYIDLNEIFGGDIGDGSTLKIGNQEYTFKWGDEFKHDGKNTITLKKDATAAERINYAAKAMTNMENDTFSIGNELTTGKITIDEKAGNTNFTTELKDRKGFESLFSATRISATNDSKGLKLQIGDTADEYNQLKVSIGDTHCTALGIDKDQISIATQEDAADAIDAIKKAINTVSDIRGTLGATQNRLDHTINNLSVMTENIQDAESTIRDVDVAEEMMAYTKNNILIQSAQAMLAQANQVPQGVLQLLQ